MSQDKTTQQTVIALKKAKSSIERILKMIEEDKYCIDILQQILAVQGLLKSSSDKILKRHLQTCFIEGMSTKDKNKKYELIEELSKVIKTGAKS